MSASTASQHGGQETTITSFYNTLIHLGMVIVAAAPSTTARSSLYASSVIVA